MCYSVHPGFYFLKKILKPGTVAHAFDPSHWEAEEGGLQEVVKAKMRPWSFCVVQADLNVMVVLMLQNAELTGMRHYARLIMLLLEKIE